MPFSPNADGWNDRFQLFTKGNSEVFIRRYLLFDRWGATLYEAKNFSIHEEGRWWDGTFKNKSLDPGIYVYLIEVSYEDGVTEVLQGDVAIVR